MTILTDGLGGDIHSLWAMNSFNMSFWSVPRSLSQLTPFFSAMTRYIAKTMLALQLTVIEVVTRSRSIPPKSISISSSDDTETPSLPTSPRAMELSQS